MDTTEGQAVLIGMVVLLTTFALMFFIAGWNNGKQRTCKSRVRVYKNGYGFKWQECGKMDCLKHR